MITERTFRDVYSLARYLGIEGDMIKTKGATKRDDILKAKLEEIGGEISWVEGAYSTYPVLTYTKPSKAVYFKQKVEIQEGDYLDLYITNIKCTGMVVIVDDIWYLQSAYKWGDKRGYLMEIDPDDMWNVEVVGNRYDNPELLAKYIKNEKV